MDKALKVQNAQGRQQPSGLHVARRANFKASSSFVVLTRRGREKRHGRSLIGGTGRDDKRDEFFEEKRLETEPKFLASPGDRRLNIGGSNQEQPEACLKQEYGLESRM